MVKLKEYKMKHFHRLKSDEHSQYVMRVFGGLALEFCKIFSIVSRFLIVLQVFLHEVSDVFEYQATRLLYLLNRRLNPSLKGWHLLNGPVVGVRDLSTRPQPSDNE